MHVPRSNELEDNIHRSVPRAQCRYATSLGALSSQYSNLVAANSKLAAQCGASPNVAATSDASLRDGSGSQDTLTRTSLTRTCGCAGCASVSPSVDTPSAPCSAPCGGSHNRAGSHAGWDSPGYRYTRRSKYRPGLMPCRVAYRTHKHNTADLQHNRLSLPARTIALRASFLQAPCVHAQYPL
jgi:hypothetical protein